MARQRAGNYIIPEHARNYLETFKKFKFKCTDIVIMGFPRSGTTVIQEMVWMIQNDMDVIKAKSTQLIDRCPILEHLMIFDKYIAKQSLDDMAYVYALWFKFLEDTNHRLIKTNIPLGLLPSNFLTTGYMCRAIYVIRDPREIVVSNYKLAKKTSPNFSLPFSHFWNSFKNNQFVWTPFFKAIHEAWQKKSLPNFFLVSYRGIVKNRRETIKLVGRFLGRILGEHELDVIDGYLNTKFPNITDLREIRRRTLPDETEEPFVRDDDEWKKYFLGPLENEVNVWVKENLKKFKMPADLFEKYSF